MYEQKQNPFQPAFLKNLFQGSNLGFICSFLKDYLQQYFILFQWQKQRFRITIVDDYNTNRQRRAHLFPKFIIINSLNKYYHVDLKNSRIIKSHIYWCTYFTVYNRIKTKQMEQHPIEKFINQVFGKKSSEKRTKWAEYLITQQFDTVDDLKAITTSQWQKMAKDIPLAISMEIQRNFDSTPKIQRTLKLKTQQGQKTFPLSKSKQREKSFVAKFNNQLMKQSITTPLKSPGNSGLSPAFKILQDVIKEDCKSKNVDSDCEFMRVRLEIERMEQVEDIARALQEYLPIKKAIQLAANLFKQSNKENKKINPIDIFFSKLRKHKVSQTMISNIQSLINKGKKLATKKLLYQQLGSINGQTLFKQMLEFFIEKPSQPIMGSNFIKVKDGLKFFQYSQEVLSQNEKSNAKSMIVFGQTGCGKSTFLNAIVNFLAGVEMQDTFRYIIVMEPDKNPLQSKTKDINDYYIKDSKTNQVYRLIDTPGFGDTEGIQKDNQLVKNISNRFKKDIECIHCVLFVIKSSTTKVTAQQQYVFQNVMDIFDRQIAPNFVFIFTFSDSGKPQVLESVKDKKYGFGNYWDQILDPKYVEVNNCGFFQKIDEKDATKNHYWEIGVKSLENLFKKVNQISPKSLTLTKQMIKTKETLNIQIIDTTQTIQQAINKRENIKKHIQAIVYHKDEINNNKNFTYQVPEDQFYSEQTSLNVTRCNNPKCFSEKNCHVNCIYGDGQDKINCSSMENGVCTVCGCHYISHTNSNIIRKVRQVMRTMINSENKRKYDKSSSQMKTSEAALKDLIGQLQAEMKKVIIATKKMEQLQEKLRKTQMSNRKPQSTKVYLQYLIQSEYKMQGLNYQKRINGYNEAIKQIELQENILQGGGNKDMEKIAKQLNERIAKNIIDSVEKGFFQRIKNFLFG